MSTWEHETALQLLTWLQDTRARGWTEAGQTDLLQLMSRPALLAYLRHHVRISQGRLDPSTYIAELRALAEGSLSDQAYLAPWQPMMALDLERMKRELQVLRRRLESSDIVQRALDLAPAIADVDLTVALLPDGQSSGYRAKACVVVDVLPFWLGDRDERAMERAVASALYTANAAVRWRIWREGNLTALGTVGEDWAVEFLARLVRGGIATTCLLEAPDQLAPQQRAFWAEAAPQEDPIAELCRRLERARRGFGSTREPETEHDELSRGHFSRYQTLGAALVERLVREGEEALRDAADDPRMLPGLLLEHGVPGDLASWCMGLGEGGWSTVKSVTVPGVVGHGQPSQWAVTVEAEPTTALAVGLAAGAAADPPGLEGLAHLVEHALVARLSRAAAGTRSVHGTTEKEATLYTFSLDETGARHWPEILRALADPLEVTPEELHALKESVTPEVDDFAARPAALLQARAEQEIFGPPFGRSLVGDPDSLARIEARHVTDFHRRFYRPGALVVGAAGRPLPSAPALDDPGTGPCEKALRVNAGTPTPAETTAPQGPWALIARTSGKTSPERYALAALHQFWATRLADARGKGLEADLTLYLGGGYLHVHVDPAAGITPAQLPELLLTWIVDASDDDLRTAAGREAEAYRSLQLNPQSLALWLAGRALFFPDEEANLDREIDRALAVEPTAARDLARRLLSPRSTLWVDARLETVAQMK
jgi:hypothetical protein